MYLPQAFEEARTDVLHAFVRSHPFGALVTTGTGGLNANHIPFLIDRKPAPFGTLRGHVARGNAAWRELTAAPDALVIFQGEHAYVTPSWYPGKREHGKVVPTWNYVVVHAFGRARVIHDAEWLHGLVTSLTNEHEAARPEPWKVSDAPDDFVAKQMHAIVGIEIPISRLLGKWKASQNRASADIAKITAGLLADGSGFAAVMRKAE
ncbi:MAG TPA: FMN-binding negative transcriptional regulator [Steroidobacteraceae bacterium]|nr:FMN-binding negative transcriptional regulator [Steroidobacteraceae bacterium]